MKLPNYLTVFFSVLMIIALLGLAGLVTYSTVDDSNALKQQVNEVIHLDEILPVEWT